MYLILINVFKEIQTSYFGNFKRMQIQALKVRYDTLYFLYTEHKDYCL